MENNLKSQERFLVKTFLHVKKYIAMEARRSSGRGCLA